MITYKEILESELFQEAVNYEDMFSGVLKFLPDDKKGVVESQYKDMIKLYKDKLQKSDRVIWFLRYKKVQFLNFIKDQLKGEDNYKEFEIYYNKQISKLPKEDINTGDLLTKLEHYLSLPIDTINNYQWKQQTAKQLLDDFEGYEREWKQQSKELILRDDEDETIIKSLGDNYYWVSLDKAYCKREGDAMGHCGNSPRSNTNDNIYSLRKLVKKGNDEYWQPHVTVTVDEEGKVWEVKGKGNAKPADRYIPYVVELFKMKNKISGQLLGVGYMPKNNLKFSDFSEEQQDEIMKANPKFEVTEQGPLILTLDEYSFAEYNFNEYFDYNKHFNREPTEEELSFGLEYDIEYDISNYTKLIVNCLEYYVGGESTDKQDGMNSLTIYLNDIEGENKEELVSDYNRLIDDLDDEIVDEVKKALITLVEEEFEINLDEEDINDYGDKGKILDFMREKLKKKSDIEYELDSDFLSKLQFYDELEDGVNVLTRNHIYKEYENEEIDEDYFLRLSGFLGRKIEVDDRQMELPFESKRNRWKRLI